ncbi:MAG: hypothetical protein ACOYMK_07800 [Hyphomonadaceae bacterium]
MRAIIVGVLALAAACSPAADTPAEGVDAITPRNPFFGTWELTAARVAPWWDNQGEEPAPDPGFTKFKLTADASSGPPIVTCSKPVYSTNIVPPRALFEGKLPDPAGDAVALGLTALDITMLTFTCEENNASVSLDFPMVDEATVLLGLDNVVYAFKRTGN